MLLSCSLELPMTLRLVPVLVVLAAALCGCTDRPAHQRQLTSAAHVRTAEEALAAGNFERALAAAEQAASYDPLNPAHRDLLLRIRLTALVIAPHRVTIDRPAEVDYQAEWMVERDPARAYIYLTARGHLALAQGELDRAERHLTQALSHDADFAPASAVLGQVLSRKGRGAEAITAYQAALARAPADGLALSGLGRALLESGDAAGAIDRLGKAVEVLDGVGPRVDLAQALMLQQRPEDALVHLLRAAALEPGSGEVRRRLGDLYLLLDQLDLAQQQFTIAAQLGAEPFATLGLGLVLYRRGQFEQAAPLLEAAGNSSHELVGALYQAALAWEQAKDPGKAARLQARYLQQAQGAASEAPRLQDAQERLVRLEAAATSAATVRPRP
jgi:tetratricopeptide (TPR) repeat protein